jgi:hypothetical protein
MDHNRSEDVQTHQELEDEMSRYIKVLKQDFWHLTLENI